MKIINESAFSKEIVELAKEIQTKSLRHLELKSIQEKRLKQSTSKCSKIGENDFSHENFKLIYKAYRDCFAVLLYEDYDI